MSSIKDFSENFKLDSPRKTRKTKQQQTVLQFLKDTEYGYARINDIPHYSIVKKLVNRRVLFKVWLSFKKGRGGPYPKRRMDPKLFNEGFYNTTFVCFNRTAVIRLFMNALKKPTTFLARRRVRSVLKRNLTYAESMAVLWNLGIHNFARSQRKRNIQIDGVYFPIKRLEEVSE